MSEILNFEKFLNRVKLIQEKSGTIVDRIQTEEHRNNKQYKVTVKVIGGAVHFSYKLNNKPSRKYVINNQESLEKYLQIFYLRYEIYRLMTQIDLFRLFKLIYDIAEITNHPSFFTRRRVISSVTYRLSAENLPMAISLFISNLDEQEHIISVANADSDQWRHIPAIIEIVHYCLKLVLREADFPAVEKMIIERINDIVIRGHHYILPLEYQIDAPIENGEVS